MSVHLVRAYPSGHGPDGGVRVTARTARETFGVTLVSAPLSQAEPPAGHLLDEHLAVLADATGRPWLPIADVIVFPGGAAFGGRAPARPGALVTSVAGPTGLCTIGIRTDEPLLFRAPMAEAERALPWVASFVHVWLVSGRGTAGFGSARLEVGWPPPRCADTVLTCAGAPAQCRASGPRRPASRSRISSAWGAPSSSKMTTDRSR